MAALGRYLHGRGLQFGLYTARGPQECCGRTGYNGSMHAARDARAFASFGVDYLKIDSCVSDHRARVPIPILRTDHTHARAHIHVACTNVDMTRPLEPPHPIPPLSLTLVRVAFPSTPPSNGLPRNQRTAPPRFFKGWAPDATESQWDQFAAMRDALNRTGRPVYLSICELANATAADNGTCAATSVICDLGSLSQEFVSSTCDPTRAVGCTLLSTLVPMLGGC